MLHPELPPELGITIPASHRDCWPIEKAQKGILTHDEAMDILVEEGYFDSPVYIGHGEYVEVEPRKRLRKDAQPR